ncbi:Nicotinamidase [Photobacterium marinum]|uniref:Nicotinamidase n=1 Tax=Photobacterium marinum TaxID=1056511 RepID=L8JFH7_9GAMM|nr:isochorismatase family cysteine hydrolase [Photobacterium marinum]ELR66239.1 Nicotinamidase [Photobacterium marinum]
MGKVAVLTNDLQYELVEKNQKRIDAVESMKESFVSFMNQIREMGHHVVHLQLVNLPDDPNAEWYGDHLPVQKGSKGAEVLSDFLDSSDIVVEKNKDSGFYETELDTVLKKLDVDTVIITGMQTQICVQTTAADAFFRGYNVWVPEDGVVSANPEDKERALTWLDGYCATVSDCETIIKSLSESGSLPRKEVKIP